MVNRANIERFDGFSKLYDESRPVPPRVLIETILSYAGKRPRVVADIGSGTGLSTFPWSKKASKVIGIEPNEEFLNYAKAKPTRAKNVEFKQGHSTKTELPDASVDIVACSQSFHWMEPRETLREFDRILKPGGVLAIYDCDWPLVMGKRLEILHRDLIQKADDINAKRQKRESAEKAEKSEHDLALERSGYFEYIRKIHLHVKKRRDAGQIIGITVSQGALQTVVRNWEPSIRPYIDEYVGEVSKIVKGKIPVIYSYELVIGIKRSR